MSAKVIAIRPEPGLSQTMRQGRAMGLEMAGFALSSIRPVAWHMPEPATIDALLLGSANGVRMAGASLASFCAKPVYAVGQQTARAASEAGLEVAATGTGGLQQMLDSLAGEHLRLLRLAGAQHVLLAPPAGIEIVQRIVYEAELLPMSAQMAALLREGALVLLHSAEAARHFAGQCDEAGIDRSRVALAALGPRIAKAAGQGWAELGWCERPQESALLALASDMCH